MRPEVPEVTTAAGVAARLPQRGAIEIPPEGTRNKSDEPYTLLPATAGIGEIIYHAKPVVIPVFIIGLQTDLATQVRSNFDGTGVPVTVTFGAPIDLADRCSLPPGADTYRALADFLRLAIQRLGQRDYEMRVREGLPLPGPAPRRRQDARATEPDRQFTGPLDPPAP